MVESVAGVVEWAEELVTEFDIVIGGDIVVDVVVLGDCRVR